MIVTSATVLTRYRANGAALHASTKLSSVSGAVGTKRAENSRGWNAVHTAYASGSSHSAPSSQAASVSTRRPGALTGRRGGPRYGPPDCSSEGGYAPLGLPRPTLGRAPAEPWRASGLFQDVSPVVDPAIEQHELPERERGQDHEQHHGQRRRVRRVPELEADVVDVIEEQLGRGVAAAEPVVGRQAEEARDLLEQPVAGRVEEQPDVGDGDHRQDRRREVRQAQERAAAKLAVDQQRHRERQRDRRRDGAEREE